MNDHAIVVGIKSYPGISHLLGPCNDAQDFYDWVVSPDGGGVDPGNAALCLSTHFPTPTGVSDAKPAFSELDALFRPLVTRTLEHGHVGDRLFVYVAGHGFADTQDMDSVALFTADAQPVYPLHLAVKAYADWLRRNWAFDEIILLADCCRTTNTFQSISSPQLPTTNGHPNATRVKAFYGFATGWKEPARERDMGNGRYRGIFTAAVMEALTNAPPNRLGRVTGTAVKNYVHTVIGKYAGDVDVSPPVIDARVDMDALFTTRPAAPGQEVSFNTAPGQVGLELVVSDGGHQEVFRGPVPDEAFTLQFEPGLYKAELPATNGSGPHSTLFEVPSHGPIQL